MYVWVIMTVQKEMGNRFNLQPEHNGFKKSWKLWSDLCWLRWLRPSLNVVSNFKPTGLCTLYIGLGMGLPVFVRAFQKVKRVLDCRIFKSNLFHEYLKISVLLYNIATSTEWELYMWLLFGIRSYKYEGKPVLLIL